MRLVVATRSGHKLAEIREILSRHAEVELSSLDDAGVRASPEEEEIEVYDTFEENALAKARYFAERTGIRTLADDSGLCVDALEGEPGVRSKRFSGMRGLSGPDLDRANNEALLQRMENVPDEDRTARYVCVLALADPTGREYVFRGECEGVILRDGRGDGGFGYDPLFQVGQEGATFAQIGTVRKNEISHRAEALRSLGVRLAAGLDRVPVSG